MTASMPYPEPFGDNLPMDSLKEDHITFLSAFLNPVYLQPKVLRTLGTRFVEESSLELHNFLSSPLAEKLEAGLRARDVADKLEYESRGGRIPPHNAGVEDPDGEWVVQGPPHKARYCTLNLPSTSSSSSSRDATKDALAAIASPDSTPSQIIKVLEQTLFPSPAFRAWLYIVAELIAEKYSVKARRFRPGLDYTLATSDDKQSILDVVLGLTPNFEKVKEDKKGKGKAAVQGEDEDDDEPEGWERGEWGGWEVCALFRYHRLLLVHCFFQIVLYGSARGG